VIVVAVGLAGLAVGVGTVARILWVLRHPGGG
jgi:hypothetical protein